MLALVVQGDADASARVPERKSNILRWRSSWTKRHGPHL